MLVQRARDVADCNPSPLLFQSRRRTARSTNWAVCSSTGALCPPPSVFGSLSSPSWAYDLATSVVNSGCHTAASPRSWRDTTRLGLSCQGPSVAPNRASPPRTSSNISNCTRRRTLASLRGRFGISCWRMEFVTSSMSRPWVPLAASCGTRSGSVPASTRWLRTPAASMPRFILTPPPCTPCQAPWAPPPLSPPPTCPHNSRSSTSPPQWPPQCPHPAWGTGLTLIPSRTSSISGQATRPSWPDRARHRRHHRAQ